MTRNLEDYTEFTGEPAFDDKYMVQDENGNADEVKYISHRNLFKNRSLVKEVTLTSAQILALNATPIAVLSGLTSDDEAFIIEGITAVKPAGTAYAGIAVDEDITFKYTNGSGTTIAALETTGFLDQTTAQVRYTGRSGWTTNAPSAQINVTPTGGADVVAYMTTGEITTGDTDLTLRIEYKIIDIS